MILSPWPLGGTMVSDPFRIGDFWVEPRSRSFAELLIDCEESPHARAVVLGVLRERELRDR